MTKASQENHIEAITKIGTTTVRQVRTPKGVVFMISAKPNAEIVSRAKDLINNMGDKKSKWNTMTIKAAKALLA